MTTTTPTPVLTILGEPGHRDSGRPEDKHPSGCAECDAWALAAMTLGRVEDHYQQGFIGQDQFEAYRYVWAANAPHRSSQGQHMATPSQIPAVREYVRLIEHAGRRLGFLPAAPDDPGERDRG